MSLPSPFSVTITDVSPKVRRLEMKGELDLATVPALQERIDELRDSSSGASVIVDLAQCSFIDSSGLASLVELSEQTEGSGGAGFAICNAREPVRRIFELTGLSQALHIAADSDAALAHVHQGGRPDPAPA